MSVGLSGSRLDQGSVGRMAVRKVEWMVQKKVMNWAVQ